MNQFAASHIFPRMSFAYVRLLEAHGLQLDEDMLCGAAAAGRVDILQLALNHNEAISVNLA